MLRNSAGFFNVGVRTADRRLRVVARRGAIGLRSVLDQLGPNRLPIVGAQHLARDRSFGRLLDRRTVFDRDTTARRHPLMDSALRHAEDVGQSLVASDIAGGDFDGMLVHVGGRYE